MRPAAKKKRLSRDVATSGRGALLRSPTLWEDVVKTICTTNVSWGNTVSMVRRLVEQLGAPYTQRHAASLLFPTPQQVADAHPALFDSQIRLAIAMGMYFS